MNYTRMGSEDQKFSSNCIVENVKVIDSELGGSFPVCLKIMVEVELRSPNLACLMRKS